MTAWLSGTAKIKATQLLPLSPRRWAASSDRPSVINFPCLTAPDSANRSPYMTANAPAYSSPLPWGIPLPARSAPVKHWLSATQYRPVTRREWVTLWRWAPD